jgi:hypothetical protein
LTEGKAGAFVLVYDNARLPLFLKTLSLPVPPSRYDPARKSLDRGCRVLSRRVFPQPGQVSFRDHCVTATDSYTVEDVTVH